MVQGVQAMKTKKRKLVETAAMRAKKRSHHKKKVQDAEEGVEGEEDEDEEVRERKIQADPLRGKIREALPQENLTRAMKW